LGLITTDIFWSYRDGDGDGDYYNNDDEDDDHHHHNDFKTL